MREKLTSITFCAAIILAFGIHPAQASQSINVTMSEISMGTSDSASDEFVEIYNNTNQSVSIGGWSIYYKSSTGKTWYKKTAFPDNLTLLPNSFGLAASVQTADTGLTSGLAQTGGVLQLRSNTGEVIDEVGWGSADTAETKPATAVQAGEVIYRQFDTSTNTMIDTDNNFEDFDISAAATPKATPAIPVENNTNEETISYPNIIINELLPDPASPASDSSDEFIELYNPNSVPINMTGWILKDTSDSSYIIKDLTVAAAGYAVLMSAETKLALNNSGDEVRLFSPDNNLVDQSEDYGTAKAAMTWGLVDGVWGWTVAPTPSSQNSSLLVEGEASGSPSKTTKKATTKKTAAKKAPKTSKLATAKTAKDGGGYDDSTNSDESGYAKYWPWLLIVLGIGTIGYGIYEYRPEISTVYHRLKAKFSTRS